jgi:hypothetical protein
MNEVKVDRVKLVAKLGENRDKHVKEYEAAIVAYRESVIDEMKKNLRLARKGEFRTSIHLPAPEDHRQDYDNAIAMMTASVEDVVTMTQSEFNQYYLDQWSWARAFAATSSFYNDAPLRKRK